MTGLTPARRRARLPRPGRIAVHTILIVTCIAWVLPLIGLVVYSFRTTRDSAASGWWTVVVAPLFTTGNFRDAWEMGGMDRALVNSVLISVPTTIITVTVCALGAYALARMRFRGRFVLLGLAVVLLIVPPQLTLVPLLRVFSELGLTGEFIAVWIYQAGFVVPFGLYLLTGFFREFPTEVLEAAQIDGASAPRTFVSIVLPTSLPMLIALAIVQFMWSWNDLLIPLLFLGGSPSVAPATVQIAGLLSSTGSGINHLTAAALVSMIIPVVIILSLQRYFIRGLLGGAVKG